MVCGKLMPRPCPKLYLHLPRDNHKRHGYGIELQANGERYEGEWVKNQRHGRGVIRFANGRWRECEFSENERTKWIGEERIGGIRRGGTHK